MIIIAALLALFFFGFFFFGFFFRLWVIHLPPNSIIRDRDGTIIYFDPWKAIRKFYGAE